MRLVVAKGALRGALVLTGTEDAIKKLKTGQRVYPYVMDDGRFGHDVGVFDHAPVDAGDAAKFHDQASQMFLLRQRDHANKLVAETFRLKGSRLEPTSLKISKIEPVSPTEVVVEGALQNAYDPRLPFLDGAEETEFGAGAFDSSQLYGCHDGRYVYAPLSPHADKIAELADQQRTLFDQITREPTDRLINELNRTADLLKPYANHIYRVTGDQVFYVGRVGHWRMKRFLGIRRIDLDDRERFRRYLAENFTGIPNLRAYRETICDAPFLDRLSIKDVAPLMEHELRDRAAADADALASREKLLTGTKPQDEFDGLPGLSKETELFPHQNYVHATTRDRDRMVFDVDPGGGKALQIIMDVLYRMSHKGMRRPLVVMPEPLLAQFAHEVRYFSQLNPWIFNTESVRKWKQGDLTTFVADAREAPSNTIFITSYNWISREVGSVPDGRMVSNERDGQTHYRYREIDIYPRVEMLLDQLGVDGVYADEAHLLRSESHQAKAATSLMRAPTVRALTGTLMPGTLLDVTGPVGAVHSGVFGSTEEFLDRYSHNRNPNHYRADAPKQIRAALKTFGVPQVRRSAWASLLPKVDATYHFVKFTPSQQKVYEALLTNTIDKIRQDPALAKQVERFEKELQTGEHSGALGNFLSRFAPLDMFLNAPDHVAGQHGTVLTDQDAVSPKTKRISEIIREHLKQPEAGKVLVFVQFREAAKNILENLDSDVKPFADYYEAGMADVLNRFKQPTSDLKILVGVDATLRTGRNLQVANCIIHADHLWTPGEMSQRDARSVRLKQAKPVAIHQIVVGNSAELLKVARLISSAHMIAKANSDFEDKSVLPQIEMTLDDMKTFRTPDRFQPYVARETEMLEQESAAAVRDRDRFGIRPIKPRVTSEIHSVLKGTKALDKVPSVQGFVGDERDVEVLLDRETAALPAEPRSPRVVKFDLQQWDDALYLTVFKIADPQGFVRSLGFRLKRDFWYIEVGKGSVTGLLEKIEKAGIKITNREEVEEGMRAAHRLLKTGQPGSMRRLMTETRQELHASWLRKVEAAKPQNLEAEFHFATIDGFPVVFSDNVVMGSPEEKALRKLGFSLMPQFWFYPVTRTKLVALLRRITSTATMKSLRVAEWSTFKQEVQRVFGLDLAEFDALDAQQKG